MNSGFFSRRRLGHFNSSQCAFCWRVTLLRPAPIIVFVVLCLVHELFNRLISGWEATVRTKTAGC